MTAVERIARAALAGDALAARSLVQDWLRSRPVLADVPPPDQTTDPAVVSLTAALVELMAARLSQRPPDWAAAVGPVAEPTYLVRAAERMRHLREVCRAEAPDPLRRRQFFAPANYLDAI